MQSSRLHPRHESRAMPGPVARSASHAGGLRNNFGIGTSVVGVSFGSIWAMQHNDKCGECATVKIQCEQAADVHELPVSVRQRLSDQVGDDFLS